MKKSFDNTKHWVIYCIEIFRLIINHHLPTPTKPPKLGRVRILLPIRASMICCFFFIANSLIMSSFFFRIIFSFLCFIRSRINNVPMSPISALPSSAWSFLEDFFDLVGFSILVAKKIFNLGRTAICRANHQSEIRKRPLLRNVPKYRLNLRN